MEPETIYPEARLKRTAGWSDSGSLGISRVARKASDRTMGALEIQRETLGWRDSGYVFGSLFHIIHPLPVFPFPVLE